MSSLIMKDIRTMSRKTRRGPEDRSPERYTREEFDEVRQETNAPTGDVSKKSTPINEQAPSP